MCDSTFRSQSWPGRQNLTLLTVMVDTKKLSLIQDDTHSMSDQGKCFRLCCRKKAGNIYHVGKLPSLQYSVAEALKSLAGCRQTEAWYRVLGQRLCGHDNFIMYKQYMLCALDMLWLCLIKRTLLCNGKIYFNCLVLTSWYIILFSHHPNSFTKGGLDLCICTARRINIVKN